MYSSNQLETYVSTCFETMTIGDRDKLEANREMLTFVDRSARPRPDPDADWPTVHCLTYRGDNSREFGKLFNRLYLDAVEVPQYGLENQLRRKMGLFDGPRDLLEYCKTFIRDTYRSMRKNGLNSPGMVDHALGLRVNSALYLCQNYDLLEFEGEMYAAKEKLMQSVSGDGNDHWAALSLDDVLSPSLSDHLWLCLEQNKTVSPEIILLQVREKSLSYALDQVMADMTDIFPFSRAVKEMGHYLTLKVFLVFMHALDLLDKGGK